MDLPWNYLPLEVWSIILKRVGDRGQGCKGDVKQLAECRLVCKAWDPLAERAMFSQKLFFGNLNTISKFYLHLAMKPHLGRCIQSMHFGNIDTDKLPFYEDFFRMAFTPNIKAVDGKIGKDSFRVILDIAKESKQKYSKLQLLPWLISQKQDIHFDTKLYFRETLTSLDLDDDAEAVERVFDRLGEFKCLTKLTLSIDGATEKDCLVKLERILNQCGRLQELELSTGIRAQVNSMEQEDLKSWLQSNVQKSYNRFDLNIPEVDHAHVLDYLVYKYPNSTGATLGSQVLQGGGNNAVDHCLEAIKDIDFVALSLWYMEDLEGIKQVVKAMRNKQNKLSIQNHDPWGSLAEMSATRYKSHGFSEFEITLLDTIALNYVVKTIGGIFDLDINYSSYQNNPEGEQLESHLYELLTIVPDIMTLKITDAHIQHQPALVEGLVLNRLTKIHICGAIIDADVLPALSKIAPLLECLTLDTCILDIKCYQNQQINLPQTDLHTLSLCATNSVWHCLGSEDQKRIDAYQWMQKSISVENYQLMFLRVARSSPKQTQYYALKPGTPSQSKQIDQDEYQRNVSMWPRVSITCKSLQVLKIKLGALVIDIDLDMDDSLIQELGDWQMDKQSALAYHLHKG